MDDRYEQTTAPLNETPRTRRLASLCEESGATYPMLAPAAVTYVDEDGQGLDQRILAGPADER